MYMYPINLNQNYTNVFRKTPNKQFPFLAFPKFQCVRVFLFDSLKCSRVLQKTADIQTARRIDKRTKLKYGQLVRNIDKYNKRVQVTNYNRYHDKN